MMMVFFRRITWFNPGDIVSDLIAGITVGLVAIPQNFMFAAVAGVPVQYAIYSSLLGNILYPILGKNKDVVVGSTILLRELINMYVQDGRHWLPQKAVMMTFVSGVCIILAAILSTGKLINRLSSSVLAGLVWSCVLSLVTAQLHHMFGIPYKSNGSSPFISLLYSIHDMNLWDVGLSSCCIVILAFFAGLKSLRLSSADKEQSTTKKVLEKTLLILGNFSGALVLVAATTAAYQLSGKHRTFTLTSATNFEPEFPSVIAPPLSTIGVLHSDWRVAIVVPFMVPVMTVLAHAAVIRAFSGPEGSISSWELASLGIINMIGSCFSCVPLGVSFGRSAINSFYGARTRVAGFCSGLIIVLYLTGVMAPYYSYIPQAAVASVTLCALVHLVRGITLAALEERHRGRMVSGLATLFIGVFFSVEYGVLVGILLDITICTLLSQKEPVLVEKLQSSAGIPYILVTPNSDVKLPTVEMYKEAVARNEVLGDDNAKYIPVVVDCRYVTLANLNAAHGVNLLMDFFRNMKTTVVFHNLNNDVAKAFTVIFPADFLYSTSESHLRRLFRAMMVESQKSGSQRHEATPITDDTNC